MTNEPTTITREQLRSALVELGIRDHDEVRRVEILPQHILVERFRLDRDGHRFAAGNQVATTMTMIAIRDEESA